MSEYDHEPIRGLPGDLPNDEHILWQSAPDWVSHVKAALHIRLAALYFGIIVFWAAMRGDSNTAIGVTVLGIIAVGLFTLFAWGVGRTTVYTLTNKRIIFRIGVALNKCINIPLSEIESANLKMLANDHGNIVLQLKGMPRLGYIMLWPHARSLRFVRPQPMLRAIPDAKAVSVLLFNATQRVQSVAPVAERTADRVHQPAFLGVTA
jgi:Bacterial PH domain